MRFPRFAPNQLPIAADATYCSVPLDEPDVLALGGASAQFNTSTPTGTTGFMRMEWLAHNMAHVTGGGLGVCLSGNNNDPRIGWLTSLFTPIQDPLFFMLHSNVDRLWAKWQQQNNRFNLDSYPDAGTAPVGGRMGQFLEDSIYPWCVLTPPGAEPGPSGDACQSGPSGSTPHPLFPVAPGRVLAPPETPMLLNAIDYEEPWVQFGTGAPTQLTGSGGLGFSYDNVPFGH